MDDKLLYSLTSQSLASTTGAWTDVPNLEAKQVTNYGSAFMGGYSDVAVELRLVQGRSSTGPWLVYQDPVLSLGAGLSVENKGVKVDLGFQWVKLQYKSSATAVVTADVLASQ